MRWESALKRDSLLHEKYLAKQFDQLFLQPLKESLLSNALTETYFIVIDALDECEDVDQIETLKTPQANRRAREREDSNPSDEQARPSACRGLQRHVEQSA